MVYLGPRCKRTFPVGMPSSNADVDPARVADTLRGCGKDVWSALQHLIAFYMREPATDGHGVYLVFWFGEAEKCPPTADQGWTPSTRASSKRALAKDARSRIRVIDVSMP